jgi:hypothetical protein
MVRSFVMVALVVFAVGCATRGLRGTDPGDLEVRAWESGSWQKDPAAPAAEAGSENFVFTYETSAFHGERRNPFHKMKTEIRLTYDPDLGEIRNAKVTSSEDGNAYRHVCFTPAGPLLRIRIITDLDGGSRDLTVVRLEGPMPTVSQCTDIGVGPWKGLVESLDVLFEKDGTYSVMRGTGAHLTESGIRFERTMSTRPAAAETITAKFPD